MITLEDTLKTKAGIRPPLTYSQAMAGGWTYIMTNRPRGVLYIGVTANLTARIHQHRSGDGSDFCRRYRLTRLVLAEPQASMSEAIAREKALKEWKRPWKIQLIDSSNPDWLDLFEMIQS